jgi:hypothetical protein
MPRDSALSSYNLRPSQLVWGKLRSKPQTETFVNPVGGHPQQLSGGICWRLEAANRGLNLPDEVVG